MLQLSALFGQLQDEAAQAAEGTRLDLTPTLDRIEESKRASLSLLFARLPECDPSIAQLAKVAGGSAATGMTRH